MLSWMLRDSMENSSITELRCSCLQLLPAAFTLTDVNHVNIYSPSETINYIGKTLEV